MGNQKPPYEKYKKWLRDNYKIRIDRRLLNNYDAVTRTIKKDFEKSDFWKDLINDLPVYEMEYRSQNGYELGVMNFQPEIQIKNFDSALNKSYRKNVKFNKKWPDAPSNGWIFPDKFPEQINDIIRTSLIVRYLDGIDFLVEKIRLLSEKHGLRFEKYQEARNDGYYSIHLYVEERYEIPPISGYKPGVIKAKTEIQVTTQLKDVIRNIIFESYKDRRMHQKTMGMDWAWDYESKEFSTNYLGHILHHLEGMIMDIRKKRR